MYRLAIFLTAGLLLFTSLFSMPAGMVVNAATQSSTLLPIADTYIDSSYSSTNFGTRTTLRVDGSPIVSSFLRFDLGQINGTITQARLRIYANTASTSGLSVYPVSNSSWSETGLTYASAPILGSAFTTSSAVSALSWKEIDVTGLITGGGLVNLALGTPGGTAISLASREAGSNAPQLVISVTSPASSTPAPATTTPSSATPTPTRTPIPTFSPTPTKTLTIVPTQTGSSVSLLPAADTYVDSSFSTTNFGTRTTLRVDGAPVVLSYIRFNIGQINGTITQARLRIFANTASYSGLSVYPVSNLTWSETGLTYANAPQLGAFYTTSSAVTAGTWKEIDVTGLIAGGSVISLALGTPGGTAISLASRESGANAPQLIVVTSSSTANVTLLAAGDIAKCGGGTPSSGSGAQITSDMLLNETGTLFTLGDNSNDAGTPTDYTNCFDPTWGRLKSRIIPSVGNHDQIYGDHQATPYFDYFGAASRPGSYGHFSLDLGSWHIVVLNAQCGVGGQGCGAGSLQELWLRADLAAHSQKCTLAIWHQPLFTSGTQSAYPEMRAFWQALYDYHADIILNGHNHNYERFAPQDPLGNPDSINGIREFVVGTGGASLDSSQLPMAANQEVRSAQAYGYLKLTLKPDSYDWQFVSQPGKSFSDSGTTTCH